MYFLFKKTAAEVKKFGVVANGFSVQKNDWKFKSATLNHKEVDNKKKDDKKEDKRDYEMSIEA